MRYRSLASYHPRYIHQFPRKSIRVIAKGSAVLPSRKSAEPFSSYKVIPAPASHSRHPTQQNSTNAAAAIILLSNRQSCFEKVRVFKVLQPFTSTFSLFPLASGKAILSDFVRLIYESQQFQIGKHTGQIRHRLHRGDAVGLPGRADNGIVSFTLRAGGPETVPDIPRRGRVAGDCGRGCPPAGARSGR